MNWIIRKAVPGDRDRIEALFVEMLQSVYEREDVSGYEAGYLDKFLSGREDWICVAEAAGKVGAYLSIEVHRDREEYLYLDDFCVSRAFRGQGIGTMLIEAAGEFARRVGIGTTFLHVEKSNAAAQRLYERMGFERCADEGSRFKMRKTTH